MQNHSGDNSSARYILLLPPPPGISVPTCVLGDWQRFRCLCQKLGCCNVFNSSLLETSLISQPNLLLSMSVPCDRYHSSEDPRSPDRAKLCLIFLIPSFFPRLSSAVDGKRSTTKNIDDVIANLQPMTDADYLAGARLLVLSVIWRKSHFKHPVS